MPECGRLSEGRLVQSDVVAIFHSALFGYQKVLRDALGEASTSAVTALTVPIVQRVIEKTSPELAKAESIDDALKRFSDLLMASDLVKRVDVEEAGEKRILHIDGCAFAEHVHDMLRPKDVTCPWAIFATSIAQGTCKRKMKMNLSEFTPLGSKTPIEFPQQEP